MFIQDTCITRAWRSIIIQALKAPYLNPLIVKIDIENKQQFEDINLKISIDRFIISMGFQSIDTVANTIFPLNLWNPDLDRQILYKRYIDTWSKIIKYKTNYLGTYFQRMIAYGDNKNLSEGINQLEHVICTWKNGNHRKSALQVSIFDPLLDHNNMRQRGFPCIQQIGFIPKGSNGKDGLLLYALLPRQTIIERTYGNLLGLVNLGKFMAKEMDLELKQINIFVSYAELDCAKKKLVGLKNILKIT